MAAAPVNRPASTAIYALTETGAATARKLASALEAGRVFLPARLADSVSQEAPFEKIAVAIRRNFNRFDGHIVIAAAGVAVRSIAPLIGSKASDPAVVVVDQEGRFAISLLSGHLGGANALAERVAEVLGGLAVITTATDSAEKPSIEMIARDIGCEIENLKALSRISLDVLENRPVPVYDPGDWLKPALAQWNDSFIFLKEKPNHDSFDKLIWVGYRAMDIPEGWLVIRPPCLAVGLGCNRGTDAAELEELLSRVFVEFGLSKESIAELASIDAKADEQGLLRLSERLKKPLRFFSRDELKRVKAPNPSRMVEKHMGVESVCEASAIMAAGNGRLIVTKRKSKNATMAAALIDWT